MQTFFVDFKSSWTPLMSFSLAKKHRAARSWKDFGQKTAERRMNTMAKADRGAGLFRSV